MFAHIGADLERRKKLAYDRELRNKENKPQKRAEKKVRFICPNFPNFFLIPRPEEKV